MDNCFLLANFQRKCYSKLAIAIAGYWSCFFMVIDTLIVVIYYSHYEQGIYIYTYVNYTAHTFPRYDKRIRSYRLPETLHLQHIFSFPQRILNKIAWIGSASNFWFSPLLPLPIFPPIAVSSPLRYVWISIMSSDGVRTNREWDISRVGAKKGTFLFKKKSEK